MTPAMNPLLPLLVGLCPVPPQDPPPAPGPAVSSAPAARLDVVELKNGDALTGTVTAELDGYVEVQLEAGATIGVSRAMVRAIRRGAVAAPSAAAAVRPADAWFVLHDAGGASVGWLHTAISTAADGSFTVSEEYEFALGARRYQVTNLCTAGADGTAVASYFRERISEPRLPLAPLQDLDPLAADDRVVDERIVEATRNGAALHISRLDGSGRSERDLPWSPDATFPLLARTLARQGGLAIGPTTMFDSAHEQLVEHVVDATAARVVELDGQRIRVTELAETSPTGRNREWIDANLRTVRRELAGPALVAVPSSATSVRAAVGTTRIEPAVVGEADGRFGLWVPNPAWLATAELPAGHVVLGCALHRAEIRLSLLDWLEPGTALETAADAVARWFVLLHPELSIESRQPIRLRERPALRLTAAGKPGGVPVRATIDVLAHAGGFLVLVCRAPRADWDELAQDFAFVQRTVELDAEALQPTLQGPLAANGQPAPRRGTAPPPVPPAAAPAKKPPVVRIPE